MDMITEPTVLVLTDTGDLASELRSLTFGGLPRVMIAVVVSKYELVMWNTDGSVSTWSRRKWLEGDFCPGHVASKEDPKICGRCGEHVDSLRPEEEEK
jgi:hypothetical protein